MLDDRLKMCADLVSGQGIACDVGTDHGYLASELILSGKCESVIASDINKQPLESAKNTIEKYKISDKVKLVLTDGLVNIPHENVTDVVIAGMGGETIINIINSVDWIKNNVRLILQPMTKSPVLRKWLYKNGYKITEEKAVIDGKFIYTVMVAKYCDDSVNLTEFASIIGQLDYSLDVSKKYLNYQLKRFKQMVYGLKESGKTSESLEKTFDLLEYFNLVHEFNSEQIYNILDELYPFKNQESWDNSGYLVENKSTVKKIMLSLDITLLAVNEAIENKCDMIISHHPVIFEPIKKISAKSVPYNLIKNNISAICMHTNLDIAEDGTNGVILKKLSEHFEFSCEPFEELGNGLSLGKICYLEKPVLVQEFVSVLKDIFKCEVVRYTGYCLDYVSRFAFCSGSGGSMLKLAMAKNCDTLITGDVKHDVWIDAFNNAIKLFDCGHFHTENLVLEHLKNTLDANLPFIQTVIAKASKDPVNYICDRVSPFDNLLL